MGGFPAWALYTLAGTAFYGIISLTFADDPIPTFAGTGDLLIDIENAAPVTIIVDNFDVTSDNTHEEDIAIFLPIGIFN